MNMVNLVFFFYIFFFYIFYFFFPPPDVAAEVQQLDGAISLNQATVLLP